MTAEKQGRRGIFFIIRSRADALNVVADAAIAFFLAAAVLAVTAWFKGWQDLVDAAFYVVLGSLMWRFKSPAAAVTLLLIAIMRFFVTVGQLIETGEIVWAYVLVTAVAVFASIRAIEATLKLIGRFAASETEKTLTQRRKGAKKSTRDM